MGSDFLPIPPEDQAAWADLLGLEPVTFICDKCKMPAAHAAAGWVHVEAADAAFCALIFGAARHDDCPRCPICGAHRHGGNCDA